jgi:hypothetical protein
MLAASHFARRWRGWQALRSLAPALLLLARLAGTGKTTSCARAAARPAPASLSLRVHRGILHLIREKPQASALRAAALLAAWTETTSFARPAKARAAPGSAERRGMLHLMLAQQAAAAAAACPARPQGIYFSSGPQKK